MNNIYRQQSSSSWIVRYRKDGVLKSKSFNDKKFGGRQKAREHAEAFYTEVKADILRGEYQDPTRNKISLSDYANDIGIYKASHKESSKRSLEETWNSRVAPYPIADKSIGNIRPIDIDNHIRTLRKPDGTEYSRSALDKTIEIIRVLLDHAVEEDLIRKNPARTKTARKSLPRAINTKKVYMNPFEVNKLYEEIKKTHPQYAVVVKFLAYTGLRSGEFRALTWDDLDLEEGTVHINKSIDDNSMELKISDPKTDKSVRTISMNKLLIKNLKEHKEKYAQPNCPYVFPDSDCSNAIRGRNFKARVLKPALKRAGLNEKTNLHSFRHTSVYLARMVGMTWGDISKRMGHKSVSHTVDLYSELFDDLTKEFYLDKFDDLELQLTEDLTKLDHSEVG